MTYSRSVISSRDNNYAIQVYITSSTNIEKGFCLFCVRTNNLTFDKLLINYLCANVYSIPCY